MTPKFALSLSFDGIRLLHRASDGWRDVGDVALDTADLSAALADLREKALMLAPDDLACKLIIPNDQIRYLSIETDDMDAATREAAVIAALDGATPYAVDDLVYDISVDGTQTHVAALAKETLGEAHAFAQEHNFNPVAAVAVAQDGQFVGEPFFGATNGDAQLERYDDPAVSLGPVAEAPVVAVQQTAVPEDEMPTPVEEAETVDAPEEKPSNVATVAAAEPPVVPQDASEAAPTDDADAAGDPALDPTQKPAASNDTTAPETDAAPAAQGEATPPAPEDPAPEADTSPDPSIGFASRRSPAGKTPSLGGAKRGAAKAPPPVPTPSVPPVTPSANVTAATLQIDPAASITPTPVEAPKAAMGFLSRRKAPAHAEPIPAPSAVATAPTTEAQRLTVFGARKEIVIGGKPKFFGLILTTVLLVFLAGVAAWATVFMEDGLARLFGAKPDTEIAAVPDGLVPETPQDQTSFVTASLEPTLSPEDAAVLDALQDPLTEPVDAQPDLSREDVEANYAVTGIWPIAPDIPAPAPLISLDDLYLTSIDPLSPAQDAVALPAAAGLDTDIALGALSTPAAAGTAFAFDSRGLIIPTRQGALSPNGITVFLGKPPLTPPERPVQVALPQIEDTVKRAVLAALRPKARPGDLIETGERTQLGGVTRSELAAYRPKLRPPSEQQIAQAENPDDTPDIVESDPTAGATRLAVVASIRPDARPRNFARLVARAKREVENQPAPTRVAAVAPRTVAPKIPSSASVAKEATIRNAISLRNVSLIGVTGKPSSRRALVRLPSGRIQRVKVGDRVDGGRVSAIGESELRYKKGSRNLVLKMPNG